MGEAALRPAGEPTAQPAAEGAGRRSAEPLAPIAAVRLRSGPGPRVARAAALLIGAALALSAASAQAACGDALPAAGRSLLPGPDGWQLAWSPQPAQLPIGRHFALEVAVCPPPGVPAPAALAVDAEMPAHRHGMNYRPSVRPLGDDRWRVEGLMWHMAGTWRLWFTLDRGPGQPPLRLSQDVAR